MHRRMNSALLAAPEFNDLSDLSDPEFFELDGMHSRRRSFVSSHENDPLNSFTEKEKRVSSFNFKPVYLRAGVSLVCWYAFSISLSVYNKYMFSESGIDFRFPILTTALHQLTQIALALIALGALRIPLNLGSGKQKLKVIPAGLASAADIGLGNTSLLVVTLSFYTMIKSSALGFVLLFSVLLGVEYPNWRLAMIICVMTVGVFLMVAGETEFNVVGFLLVLGASCSSGLRWALVKILLSGNSNTAAAAAAAAASNVSANANGNARNVMADVNIEESQVNAVNTAVDNDSTRFHRKPHPVQTILALSPVMFVALAVLGLVIETPQAFVNAELWKRKSIPAGICAILFPGLLAFAMTWAEFELLNATGPLTLAVAGICKEVATIIVSVLVFKDKLSAVNGLGLVVTILSIGLYHYHRIA